MTGVDARDPEEIEAAREYLEARVIKDPRSGCWIWQKAASGGYGRMRWGSDFWLAHRFSFHFLNRYLHKDEVVHHRCAESLCIRPDHLQAVSHRDNMAEMMGRRVLLDEIAGLQRELTEALATVEALKALIYTLRRGDE